MPLTDAMLARFRAKQVDRSARPTRTSVRERSYSDELVTVETALTVSTVIAIIRLKAQDLASIPLLLYARRGRSKFRAYDSPYFILMHDQPNPEMSSVVFRELIVSHIDAWGDFFSQKIVDDSGVVRELWPLRPDRMSVERVDGKRIYKYNGSDGKMRVFFEDEILHLPGFGFDGLRGMSRIGQARHLIGWNISTQKYSSKFFSNGANIDMVFQHPKELSEKAHKALDTAIKEKYTGSENSHKHIILEEGMTVDKLGIPPDDAQFIETMKFQLSELNRMLGPVPPHLIGDLEKSTSWGTGIDAQEQGYINHSLMPYARRIEQGLGMQLMLTADRAQGFFYEHLFDGFLRGDIATRYEAHLKAINGGFSSRNEVREKENMNPRKGLDDILQPLNMTTVGGSDASNGAVDAFAPLWRDAIARVMKRESNDVLGASRRWQGKGQQDAFERWVDHFFTVDHPAFALRQFEPILRAHQRLFANDDGGRTDVFLKEFLDDRRLHVKTLSADELVDGMDTYTARGAQTILSAVQNFLAAHPALPNENEMELDYVE